MGEEEHRPPAPRPILVTGIPRSGTTWVGRMLCAGGGAGYLNEPFNLATSPGTLRIPTDYWYPYICSENEGRFLPPLTGALRFEYPLQRELRKCRTRNDLHHTLKSWWQSVGWRGRRPLVKEPHAIFSAPWFAERLGSDVVITVRHPAAVVASWKRLSWDFDFDHLLSQPRLVEDWLRPYTSQIAEASSPGHDLVDRVALFWRIVYDVVGRFEERFPGFYIVRQEDLSLDPLAQYELLYRSVGFEFTDAAASEVERSSARTNPKETRADRPHETRLDSHANLASWRGRLTSDELTRVRRITETTSSAFYDDW